MASNQSEGVIQVIDNSASSINDALRQTTDRIDGLKGLRGRANVYDRVGVSSPTQAGDAVNLSTLNSRLSSALSTGTMVYATDAVYYLDSNEQMLHGFGNV